MENFEQNKKVIRDFTPIFKNEHNVNGVDHLFAPDFTHHFRMPLPPGLEGFKAIGAVMNTSFPDVVVTEEDLIAEGDKVVERSSAVATHKADFMGVPATNKKSIFIVYRMEKLLSTGWN